MSRRRARTSSLTPPRNACGPPVEPASHAGDLPSAAGEMRDEPHRHRYHERHDRGGVAGERHHLVERKHPSGCLEPQRARHEQGAHGASIREALQVDGPHAEPRDLGGARGGEQRVHQGHEQHERQLPAQRRQARAHPAGAAPVGEGPQKRDGDERRLHRTHGEREREHQVAGGDDGMGGRERRVDGPGHGRLTALRRRSALALPIPAPPSSHRPSNATIVATARGRRGRMGASPPTDHNGAVFGDGAVPRCGIEARASGHRCGRRAQTGKPRGFRWTSPQSSWPPARARA